jgi:hypothetical protein
MATHGQSSGRLDGFQPGFPFMLGVGFADPDHTATDGEERVIIEDKFNSLASPEVKTSAEPEAFFRGIEDKAREPLRLPFQIDDQTGASLRPHTL